MLIRTSEVLTARGHSVFPFAVDEEATLPTPLSHVLPPAATHDRRTKFAEAWASAWSLRSYRAIARAIEQVRPDVAHVHHIYERLTTSVLDALYRRDVPTVMTLHDYKAVCPNYRFFVDGQSCVRCLSGRYFEVVRHRCLEGSRWRSMAAAVEAHAARSRSLYRRVDALVSPSTFLRDRMVEGGLPADRIRVLPNPVVAARRPRLTPASPPYVLFAGRLVAEKGIDVLLDAARLLPEGVRVRIAGSGRLAEHARRRITAERLRVDLLGPLPPAAVVEQLRGAVAAVLPALWWENCPMAMLEGSAQGVPVVASGVGGIPELVEDGLTGRLVPPGDAAALADALTGLVDRPAEAVAMGHAGWRRVRERHDPGRHVDDLLAIYTEAAGR